VCITKCLTGAVVGYTTGGSRPCALRSDMWPAAAGRTPTWSLCGPRPCLAVPCTQDAYIITDHQAGEQPAKSCMKTSQTCSHPLSPGRQRLPIRLGVCAATRPDAGPQAHVMITVAMACVCNRRSTLTAQQVSVTCQPPTDGPKTHNKTWLSAFSRLGRQCFACRLSQKLPWKSCRSSSVRQAEKRRSFVTTPGRTPAATFSRIAFVSWNVR
jgi:hypothetical protein